MHMAWAAGAARLATCTVCVVCVCASCDVLEICMHSICSVQHGWLADKRIEIIAIIIIERTFTACYALAKFNLKTLTFLDLLTFDA